MRLVKKGSIPASYCDSEVKLSPVGAFQIVEDLVTEMMGELQIDGLICIREYRAMWIFVRNRIEMMQDFKWKDEYTAECFISMIGKAKLHVDTLLKKADGEIALASRLEMCALDLETGKLRKTDTVGITEEIIPEEPSFGMRFLRGKYEPERLLETCRVRSSDIDYLHHTNNISYIRYLINQWSAEDLAKRPVRAIEVQYAGQTYEADELNIWACREQDVAAGAECFTITRNKETILNCRVERARR